MPPYCEEHQMHHTHALQCIEMREAARREQKATARREKAERIAAEVIASDQARVYTERGAARGYSREVRNLIAAAALAALTETEN